MTVSAKDVTAAKVCNRKCMILLEPTTKHQRNPFSGSSSRTGNLSPMRKFSLGTHLLSQANKRILGFYAKHTGSNLYIYYYCVFSGTAVAYLLALDGVEAQQTLLSFFAPVQ